VLSLNTYITSLDIIANRIFDEGAIALALNRRLLSLDVSLNTIGDEAAKAFARNTTLTRLNLMNNVITDDGAGAFIMNSTLTNADIGGYNNVSKEAKIKLKEKLADNLKHQQRRRNNFARNLLLLSRILATKSVATNNMWSRIPPDLRRYILLEWICSDVTVASAVGKPCYQLKAFLKYLFTFRDVIKEHLSSRMQLRILQTTTPSREVVFQLVSSSDN